MRFGASFSRGFGAGALGVLVVLEKVLGEGLLVRQDLFIQLSSCSHQRVTYFAACGGAWMFGNPGTGPFLCFWTSFPMMSGLMFWPLFPTYTGWCCITGAGLRIKFKVTGWRRFMNQICKTVKKGNKERERDLRSGSLL